MHFEHIQVVPLTRTLDVIILEDTDQVSVLCNDLDTSRSRYINAADTLYRSQSRFQRIGELLLQVPVIDLQHGQNLVYYSELNWKWPCGETPLFIFDRCARGIWWPDFVYRWFVGYSDTHANVATAIARNTYKGFSYGY